MAKIEKTLSYINTERKGKGTGTEQSSAYSRPFVGPISALQGDYLLKSIWDKVFEIRADSNGNEYIFGKLPVVTQYGITMYAGNENLDIPSIYAGIPVDGTTITKREDGTLMVNPDIKLGGASNWDDLEGKPSWIGSTKPSYSYSEIEGAPDLGNYALRSDVTLLSEKLNDFLEGSDTDTIINKWKELEAFLSGLSESDNLAVILSNKADKSDLIKYVTIADKETITGEKNFTGGLKVNGSPIYYDTEKKYWKFEGDLLVTGGVTMYGNDSEFIPSTIMDAIQTDGVTIRVNPTTKNLEVIGNLNGATTLGGLSNVGTWADSVADVDRIMYQQAGSSMWVAKSLSSIGGGVSGDYLPLSGGTISGDFLVSNSYGGLVLTNTLQQQSGFLLYRGAANWFITDNGWNSEYRMLHEGNYSNYALPISGGTLNGALNLPINTYNYIGNDLALWVDSSTPAVLRLYSPNNVPNIAFFDKSGWCGTLSLTNRTILEWNDNTLLHSGNYSSYALPLTGGTITGDLGLTGTLNNRSHFLFAEDVDSARWIVTDKYWANQYLLWHSGNDGSGSGLDADLLDGYDIGSIVHYADVYDSGTVGLGKQAVTYWRRETSSGYTDTYGTSLHLFGAYSWANRLDISTSGNIFLYQGINTTTMTKIGQIAMTHSNVASATKLQTARTIFGQTFDGTQNVSQYVTDIYAIKFVGNYGIWQGNGFTGALTDSDIMYNAVTHYFTGNVGIGTTSPRYKLVINSSVGDAVRINTSSSYSCIIYSNNGAHTWSVGSNNSNQFYFYNSCYGSIVAYIDGNGNYLSKGGITMYSQRSLKNIVDERGLSLSELSTIKPTRYTWKDNRDNRLHIGGIADDIQQVLPEVVYKTGDNVLTMDYGNAAFAIASSLIKPVIDHEQRIVMLERENKELKKELAYVKRELESN